MKNNIFNETKKNIVITSISIVMLSLLIFSFVIVLFYRINLYKDIDAELDLQFKIITNTLNMTQTAPFQMQENTTLPAPQGGLSVGVLTLVNPRMIIVISKNDYIVSQSSNRYFEEGQNLSVSEKSAYNAVDLNNQGYNFRCRSLLYNSSRLILLINTDSEHESFVRLINIILFSFAVLAALSLYLSTVLAGKVIRPVNKAYDEQVQFVQNASHEMRTPLAVIKGKLELLAIHPNGTIEENFDQISVLMSEVHNLERLNKDLLALSKEDVDADIVKTQFNLKEMVDEFSEFYETAAESQNKEFRIEIKNDVSIFQDYHRFKQSIMILIENAFKYTDENDTVTLKVENDDKNLYIKVIDTGIGIKDEDKALIFERFFRSADVRGRNIEGSGIGLSILQSLSKTLGFKIGMSSVFGKGTEFTLIYKIK